MPKLYNLSKDEFPTQEGYYWWWNDWLSKWIVVSLESLKIQNQTKAYGPIEFPQELKEISVDNLQTSNT